jgi:hypothetical protein
LQQGFCFFRKLAYIVFAVEDAIIVCNVLHDKKAAAKGLLLVCPV